MSTFKSLIDRWFASHLDDRETFNLDTDYKIYDLARCLRDALIQLDTVGVSPGAGSVVTQSLDASAPTSGTGNPIDPMSPPSFTSSGPTFLTSNTSNGNIVLSINNTPVNNTTLHGFNNGAPAAQFTFSKDGTYSATQTSSISTGDAGNATLNNHVALNINGDIFSNGPIIREFAAGINMPVAAGNKVLDITTTVFYGKIFDGNAPPSTAIYNNISSSPGCFVTTTAHVTSCEVLLQAGDLTNGDLSIYAHGFISFSA